MQPEKKIIFSHNHNNKLNRCTFFTAIGICNDHNIGDKMQVWHDDKFIKNVAVENKYTMLLHNIPDIITFLDCELSNEDFAKKIKEKCANKNIDFDKEPMYIYLLKTLH